MVLIEKRDLLSSTEKGGEKMKKNFFMGTAFLLVLAVGFFVFYSGDAIAGDELYQIEISGLWPGGSVYSTAVQWAKLINENSRSVNAVAREGKGPNIDMKGLIRYPDERKKLVYFGVEDDWWSAQQGLPGWKPFEGKYDFDNFRHICMIGFVVDVMLTTNESIRSMHDMTGKSFSPAERDLNNAKSMAWTRAFKLAGVKPNYRPLGTKQMIESCRDGLLDVAHGGIILIGPHKFMPSPYLNELFATKKVYPVTMDLKYLKEMKEKTGHPGVIVEFGPNAINEHQNYPVCALGKAMTWMCDKSIPEEVIKEILGAYYNNIEKFAELTAGGRVLTKKTIAAIDVPESRFHPGAVEFFKANEVQITSLKALGYVD
jgi:TRAP-type uncharacterized transport system substrate-binding protein